MNQSRGLYWVVYGIMVLITLVLFVLWYRQQADTHEIALWVFGGLFTVAMFIFVFMPAHDREEAVEKTRLAYLYERKDVVYENLRDLNFEHKSGKFSEGDFETMRGAMEAEAARILAEIEKLEEAKA